MIGKIKRKIRVSMMSMTLLLCALITLVLWVMLLRTHQTGRILEVMAVCLCLTGIAELITFFTSLGQCHKFTRHINTQNNIQLIDADTFQKADDHYALGSSWLVYHTGIRYYVFSKENNRFACDKKHLVVITDQANAFCFPVKQDTMKKIQEWEKI